MTSTPHDISGNGLRCDFAIRLHLFDRWIGNDGKVFRHFYLSLWLNDWRIFAERCRKPYPAPGAQWCFGAGRIR